MPRNKKKGGLNTKNGLVTLMGKEALTTNESGMVVKKKENTGIQTVSIHKIKANPNQPRKHFAPDELATLVESIKQHGLIQPLVVTKTEDGYQLVAGERRWRAAKEAGLEELPVVIKNYSTEEITEIALVENLQRQNLDPIEEAYAYQRLVDVFKLSHDKIAFRLGRSRSHVANMVRLLKLPEYIRNDVSSGELTVGQVRPLLTLPEELQKEAWQQIKERELSARQVEQLVAQLKKGKRKASVKPVVTAELRAITDQVKANLGVPVAIKFQAGKKVRGKVEITFKSQDELEYVLAYMQQEEGYRDNKSEESVPSSFTV